MISGIWLCKYKTVLFGSRPRANQLAATQKEELTEKLAQFASPIDNLEEIFENKEQIEVSKFYERLPKAHAIAIDNWLSEKIYYRKPENK